MEKCAEGVEEADEGAADGEGTEKADEGEVAAEEAAGFATYLPKVNSGDRLLLNLGAGVNFAN